MDHLDLYKEETYKFVDALLDEYMCGEEPVFIGPDVHIGTDEYNKKEAEQYRYFTDRYLKYVASYGKTPRMWGGLKWLPGKTPVQAEGVTVNAWSFDWVDPEVSIKEGYKLINTCDTYLYIVPGAGYYREFLNPLVSIYDACYRSDDSAIASRTRNSISSIRAGSPFKASFTESRP